MPFLVYFPWIIWSGFCALAQESAAAPAKQDEKLG